ncbi:hypothetical protein P872_20820 [Rhodonellum psychrophilum GCM71 = DSM 17998]|uniref:Uncharacterized protein n=1 Tax=Rhodonellum psychrophilum GCM71 = DSM 17998 TaxID=1123057 RepID=U5BU98_9BACT|nr:hypothetical protein P872_20820 [Rhodonellum psychrophilum GCM71 = DSM 17998]
MHTVWDSNTVNAINIFIEFIIENLMLLNIIKFRKQGMLSYGQTYGCQRRKSAYFWREPNSEKP